MLYPAPTKGHQNNFGLTDLSSSPLPAVNIQRITRQQQEMLAINAAAESSVTADADAVVPNDGRPT